MHLNAILLFSSLLLSVQASFPSGGLPSIEEQTNHYKTQYPEFEFVINKRCKGRPIFKEDNSGVVLPKNEFIVGSVEHIKSYEGKHVFVYYSPPEHGCGYVEVYSNNYADLAAFRRELIEMKNNYHLRDPDFTGVTVDPDLIVKVTPKIIKHSIQSLTRTVEAFLPEWRSYLVSKPRGSFIITYVADQLARTLQQPDVIVGDNHENLKHFFIQVINPPSFGQDDFEHIANRHLSSYAFIPAASAVLDVEPAAQGSYFRFDKHAVPTEDWRAEFVDRSLNDPSIMIDTQDLHGDLLDEINKTLEKTNEFITWQDVPICYENSAQSIVKLAECKRKMDLFFTADLKFHKDVSIQLIKEKSAKIKRILYFQYRAMLLAIIAKPSSPRAVHFYPLVDIKIPELWEINLDALIAATDNLIIHGPQLDIHFHIPSIVPQPQIGKVRFPSSKNWINLFDRVKQGINVKRRLLISDPETPGSVLAHEQEL